MMEPKAKAKGSILPAMAKARIRAHRLIRLKSGVNSGCRSNGAFENVGKWFAVNGEAIYGTRPWYMFGKGHNEIGHKDLESSMGARDFRYTTKGDVLYAFVLDWPKTKRKNHAIFPNIVKMNSRIKGDVKSVKLLGYNGELKWKMHADGLPVSFPDKKVGEYAHNLKIEFK